MRGHEASPRPPGGPRRNFEEPDPLLGLLVRPDLEKMGVRPQPIETRPDAGSAGDGTSAGDDCAGLAPAAALTIS